MPIRLLLVAGCFLSAIFGTAGSANAHENFDSKAVIATGWGLTWGLPSLMDGQQESIEILKSRRSPTETDYQFLRTNRGADFSSEPLNTLFFEDNAFIKPGGGRISTLVERQGQCHESGLRIIRQPAGGFEAIYAALIPAVGAAGSPNCLSKVHFVAYAFPTSGCIADLCVEEEWDSDKNYSDINIAFSDVGLSIPSINNDGPPMIFFYILIPIIIIALAVFLYPVVRIVGRTGLSKWWALLAIVPYGNVAALWILAFCKWPALDGLRRDDARN